VKNSRAIFKKMIFNFKGDRLLSQFSLNPNLKNPFVEYDLTPSDILAPSRDLVDSLQDNFEDGKILIIEGFIPKSLEYFLDQPGVRFPDWVPPVEDHEILKDEINSTHPFWQFYPDEVKIRSFQHHLRQFQESWEPLQRNLFPRYDYKKRYWSWRMNEMELGFLHLDVPPRYKEHQMRSFMNLSRRARIIEVGPTFESLIAKYYSSEKLDELRHLDATDYLQEIKNRLFKKLKLDEHYLPRHSLRLAPGAIWISHSSLITHGIVYGEKTVCLETRIPAEQIRKKERLFSKIFEDVKHQRGSTSEDFKVHQAPL
jgi:hypothetical protein